MLKHTGGLAGAARVVLAIGSDTSAIPEAERRAYKARFPMFKCKINNDVGIRSEEDTDKGSLVKYLPISSVGKGEGTGTPL